MLMFEEAKRIIELSFLQLSYSLRPAMCPCLQKSMRVIGILGGMSSSSTNLYYQRLNEQARRRLGGLHSADCLIRSVDFAVIEQLQKQGDWQKAGAILAKAACGLEAGGAELLILATNTMHKVAKHITDSTSLPFIHIADATSDAILAAGFRSPGLMATAYTMEQDFYISKLVDQGLNPLIPEPVDRLETHRIIFEELCKGVVLNESREAYEGIARRLVERGADCMILGCTEVGMLLNSGNVPVPVFDTTLIHCDKALDAALSPE